MFPHSKQALHCRWEYFPRQRKSRGGRQTQGEKKEPLINKLWILSVSIIQAFLFCYSSPKSNSWWHKKGEFVLMFVQRRGNLLNWDLENQNSLPKLSDPGCSRALDKQDWLFQRHAYITPIWVSAITLRQHREFNPDILKRFWWKNIARSVDFFIQTTQKLRYIENTRAFVHDKHVPNVLSPAHT